MAEVIVVGFKNSMNRASEVLNELLSLNDQRLVDLHDAVAVYRDHNGKLRVDQSYLMTTGQGASWGGLLGLLLGAVLAIPFNAAAGAAAAPGAIAAQVLGSTALGTGLGAADALGWKNEYGISDDFVQSVGAMIQPRDSAIFVLLQAGNPEILAERFLGYGGTVLRTTLSHEEQAELEQVLAHK